MRHGPVVPRVESALRTMLAEGRWRPGERLPNEVALAAELGVGRSSVREAVRLLAHDGLVEVRHGSGTYAAQPPAPAGEGDMRRLLRRARLREVYEVRRALEVEAARLAAGRIRPEDIGRLRDHLSLREERVGGDPAAFIDADLAFHRTVVELSGNAVLLGLLTSVLPVLREALVEMVSHEPALPDVSCAHAELLDGLARGDADAAIAATVSHLEAVMELFGSNSDSDSDSDTSEIKSDNSEKKEVAAP
ncbi:FadR/GntR family transcriptional regulator [Streptomyces javensis]|uniref:FadR/GntR family transcriptional regulator n=1 Tax=Streptomyces javensis TaxID=114698 RepID=UPI001FE9E657|nr:FadR/GntR family transcriptional regulator [Streptomyces javensis]